MQNAGYSRYYNETRAHLGLARTRRDDELSNDLGPLSPYQFYPDCIIATDYYKRKGLENELSP
jgi:hypothetical protein